MPKVALFKLLCKMLSHSFFIHIRLLSVVKTQPNKFFMFFSETQCRGRYRSNEFSSKYLIFLLLHVFKRIVSRKTVIVHVIIPTRITNIIGK